MGNLELNFLEYANAIEKMMGAWHEYSQETFKNSTNLGSAREHFVKEILANFLPKSVVVGSGEITDGKQRSGQQDVIVYRAEFPVLSGFNSVNTYMIEGVIATIEVKSDLSTGSPNGLYSAFQNIATVLRLNNQAVKLSGSQREFKKLQQIRTVKTFVVGYKGWNTKETLLENYRLAANNSGWNTIPTLVYQPKACVIANTGLVDIRQIATNQSMPPTATQVIICEQNSFALFFQNLLKAILIGTGGLIASAPEVNATMMYSLNNYFSLPKMPCAEIKLLRKTGEEFE
jgi:hypothetical protein